MTEFNIDDFFSRYLAIDPNNKVSTSSLYYLYRTKCKNQTPLDKNQFGKKLYRHYPQIQKHNYKRKDYREYFYVGIRYTEFAGERYTRQNETYASRLPSISHHPSSTTVNVSEQLPSISHHQSSTTADLSEQLSSISHHQSSTTVNVSELGLIGLQFELSMMNYLESRDTVHSLIDQYQETVREQSVINYLESRNIVHSLIDHFQETVRGKF